MTCTISIRLKDSNFGPYLKKIRPLLLTMANYYLCIFISIDQKECRQFIFGPFKYLLLL